MSRLRDVRLQRQSGTLDWVFITILLAFVLMVVGVSMFVNMFSHREYWEGDPTMPSVFVMFSRIINNSTIGVLCIFIAVVIATAAVLLWFLRSKHELLVEGQALMIAQNQQIIGMLSSRNGLKPSATPWPIFDTGQYRVLRQRQDETDRRVDEFSQRIEEMDQDRARAARSEKAAMDMAAEAFRLGGQVRRPDDPDLV